MEMSTAYHEISRRRINLNKLFESKSSWEHSFLSIVTDKGLDILTIAHNFDSFNKCLNFDCSSIPCPKNGPAQNIFYEGFRSKMSERPHKLNQLVLDPALWVHNIPIMQQQAAISMYEWSPLGLVTGSNCVLAILNNLGYVEIFARERNNWRSISKVSNLLVIDYVTKHSVSDLTDIDKFRETCYALYTNSICWSPKSVSNESCYFVTVQKDKNICFWSMKSYDETLDVEYINSIKSEIGEINTVKCIANSDNVLLLVCSNFAGQLYVFHLKIDSNQIIILRIIELWSHQDKMISKIIKYLIINNDILLLFTKNRHLVVQLLDNELNVTSQYVKNLNDYSIISLTQNVDIFYASTANSKVFKINVMLEQGDMTVNILEIKFKDNYSNFNIYGFCSSPNSVIAAMNMISKKVHHKKGNLKIDVVFVSHDSSDQNELHLLLKNPTLRLTNMSDCIELLRYKVMKSKCIPAINYNDLYILEGDPYYTKLYLIFTNFYLSLDSILRNKSENVMPETSISKIKEVIMFKHTLNLINELLQLYIKNCRKISPFQKEALVGCFKYVSYFCNEYNYPIEQCVDVDNVNVVGKPDDVKYICQCCDEDIYGLSCKFNHPNQFCVVTMTPILDDFLECRACGAIARIELNSEKPLCTFCDVFLQKYG